MRTVLTAGLTAGLVAGLAIGAPGWAQTGTETQTGTGEPPQEQAAEASYDASTVLATVNGTDITLGNLVVLRQRLPAQYANLPDDALLPGLLEQLVDQTLLAETVSSSLEEDPLEVKLIVENERRGALAARAVQESTGSQIGEAEVQAAYDEAVGGMEAQPEYNASHILVATEEEAQALKAEIEAGADFAEVAKENSTDGTTAAAGGDLGWFGPGQMVPEFETAVAGMEVGEVAGPIQTQFGWHLVKLNDQRESTPPALEEVRPEIENQLRQAALRAELERLRTDATIEMPETGIPASAISDTSILEN